MNWDRNIKRLLGAFWTQVFEDDRNFIRGVENLALLEAGQQQAYYERLAGRERARVYGRNRVVQPIPMLFLKARLDEVAPDTYELRSHVNHPAADFDAILAGDAETGDVDEHGGWLMHCTRHLPPLQYISDHVTAYKITLMDGMDYEASEDGILLHVDPAELTPKLDVVQKTDPSGAFCEYYLLYGWPYPELMPNDPVSLCYDTALTPYADIVWDMHINGADYLNTKKLLAAVSDSVVSSEDGAVTAVWTEQDRRCVKVGDLVYSAPSGAQCNVASGDNVKAGDVLFGDLVFMAGADIPDAGVPSIPGIRVRTDVGELVAENTDKAIITRSSASVGTVKILPLTSTDAAVQQAYYNHCVELAESNLCPKIDLGSSDSVNPFMFVMKKLRAGRSIYASMVVDPCKPTQQAFDCIRRTMSVTGMLTIYASASTDTAVVESSFMADAGNGIVAVDATVTVQDMFSEAKVLV